MTTKSTSASPFWSRVIETLRGGHSADARVGTFFMQTFPGCEGRNPRTGAVVVVPPKRLPFFVPSDALLAAALRGRSDETAEQYRARLFQTIDPTEIAEAVVVACTDADLDDFAQAFASPPVELPGLGRFEVRERIGDAARISIVFHPADALRDALVVN